MAKAKTADKPKKQPKSKGGKRAAKEAKADAVDVAVGSLLAGDNMPPIKDLSYHYRQILGLMKKASEAQSLVTDAKKKAKEAGVDIKALMDTKALMGMDPLDLASLLKQKAALLQNLGAPVQFVLFEPKFGSIDEQAKSEGWAAGKAGRSPDGARWPEGTPGHEAYMRAWNDAQRDTVLAGQKKPDEDEFDAAAPKAPAEA